MAIAIQMPTSLKNENLFAETMDTWQSIETALVDCWRMFGGAPVSPAISVQGALERSADQAQILHDHALRLSGRLMVHKQLERVRRLRQNWDGDGADPINPAIIATASRFLAKFGDSFRTSPRVVPMTMGRVQLEWHRGNRSLEIEFETPELVHYLKWDSDEAIEEEELIPASSEVAIRNLLLWFSSEKRNADPAGRRSTSA